MDDNPAMHTTVSKIVASLYGLEPRLTRYSRSVGNHVYKLSFDGVFADKVIKLAGERRSEKVLREQYILRAIAGIIPEAPVVEFTQDNCGTWSVPFFTMAKSPGTSLFDGYKSGVEWAKEATRNAGRFLARLSTFPLRPLVGGDGSWSAATYAPHLEMPNLLALSCAGERKLDDGWVSTAFRRAARFLIDPAVLLQTPPRSEQIAPRICSGMDESRNLGVFIDRASKLLLQERKDAAHGSFSPKHILCEGPSISMVIDWEFAGPGFILSDVGHFLASLRVWYGGRDHLELANCFIDGFNCARPLSPDDRREILDWEILWFLVWAEYYASQNRQGKAPRILNLSREYSRAKPPTLFRQALSHGTLVANRPSHHALCKSSQVL
jgi:Ser/Thr protein kinase RdoA (MazF antagonist)